MFRRQTKQPKTFIASKIDAFVSTLLLNPLFLWKLRRMKRFVPYLFTLLSLLLPGCSGGGRIASFWDGVDIKVDESNYNEAKDRFIDFAEMALDSPAEKTKQGLDAMFDKLLTDEVAYYVYEEWCEGAFYNIFSPYHNPELFEHVAARLESDGIMPDRLERIKTIRHYNSLNLKGQRCSIPALTDAAGIPVELPSGQDAVILVINTGCRTCTSALASLAEKPGRHVAICFGSPAVPDIPGWDYCFAHDIQDYFDTEAAPFWFAIDGEGSVTIPYSAVPGPGFHKPQNL